MVPSVTIRNTVAKFTDQAAALSAPHTGNKGEWQRPLADLRRTLAANDGFEPLVTEGTAAAFRAEPLPGGFHRSQMIDTSDAEAINRRATTFVTGRILSDRPSHRSDSRTSIAAIIDETDNIEAEEDFGDNDDALENDDFQEGDETDDGDDSEEGDETEESDDTDDDDDSEEGDDTEESGGTGNGNSKCNAGRGNGDEGCDPGNSGGVNQGGD